MATVLKDKATGARFRMRSGGEQRERNSIHHSSHQEELLKALVKVLTSEQKAQLKELLKNCKHGCVKRALDDA